MWDAGNQSQTLRYQLKRTDQRIRKSYRYPLILATIPGAFSTLGATGGEIAPRKSSLTPGVIGPIAGVGSHGPPARRSAQFADIAPVGQEHSGFY